VNCRKLDFFKDLCQATDNFPPTITPQNFSRQIFLPRGHSHRISFQMLRRLLFATFLVAAAMGLPQTVPSSPFLPPPSAGAGVVAGTTPLGGGVGVGAVSAYPSQPYIPDLGADLELVKVNF